MAINLQTHVALSGLSHNLSAPDPLAVLYSNRSAANAALGHWDDALDDADACIAFAPKWSKVRCMHTAASSVTTRYLSEHYLISFVHSCVYAFAHVTELP